jgi:hypothetical protein
MATSWEYGANYLRAGLLLTCGLGLSFGAAGATRTLAWAIADRTENETAGFT